MPGLKGLEDGDVLDGLEELLERLRILIDISTLLKKAVEWGELERLPSVIKLLPNPKKTMGLHDFDQYERLLTVAHLSPAATEDAIRLLDGRHSSDRPAKAGHRRGADRAENLETFWTRARRKGN